MTKLHSAIHAFISSLDIIKYIYDHRLPHQTDYERGVLEDEIPRGEILNGTPSLTSFLRAIKEERYSWRIGIKTPKGIVRVQYCVFDRGFRVEISPDIDLGRENIELTPIAGTEEIEVRTEGFRVKDDLIVVNEDGAVELFQKFYFVAFG
jgi:hypothetical protein